MDYLNKNQRYLCHIIIEDYIRFQNSCVSQNIYMILIIDK